VVQSWRGQKSLAEAGKQGYSGLLSFGYYLDLMWPAARHYAVDPMSDAAATLTPEEQKSILGGESCQWAEWVTPENIDSHIWPRNAAIAERLWSPQSVTDAASMYTRMNAVSLNLEFLGLTHRSARMHMLHRMSGTADITALRVLADVVEPVKDYNRWSDSKGPIDFHAPLSRMIDAAYPRATPRDSSRTWCRLTFQVNIKIKTRKGRFACGWSCGATTTATCIRCWRRLRSCRRMRRSRQIFRA